MTLENYICRETCRRRPAGLAVCGCCEEVIRQERALHILSGRRRMWICDRCIDDMMEDTGYEE